MCSCAVLIAQRWLHAHGDCALAATPCIKAAACMSMWHALGCKKMMWTMSSTCDEVELVASAWQAGSTYISWRARRRACQQTVLLHAQQHKAGWSNRYCWPLDGHYMHAQQSTFLPQAALPMASTACPPMCAAHTAHDNSPITLLCFGPAHLNLGGLLTLPHSNCVKLTAADPNSSQPTCVIPAADPPARCFVCCYRTVYSCPNSRPGHAARAAAATAAMVGLARPCCINGRCVRSTTHGRGGDSGTLAA